MQEGKTPKPKWLRRLERESWQAELIISGAAIFGTLQLPYILEQSQYYLLLNYDRSALQLWFFATSYWALFVYSLIILFIFHFAVRAIWIGLVGLNSIYPEGIVENNLTSKDFQDKIQKEYGDIDGFIAQLDRLASGLFGTGFAFAGIFLNLGLIVSLSIILVTWLQGQGLSQSWSWVLGLSPIGMILLFSLFSSLLSLPFLRKRAWVKRWHFPMTKLVSRLVYPVNTRFTQTGLMLISSQSAAKTKKTTDYISGVIIMMLSFFLVGLLLVKTDALRPEFLSKVYHRLGDEPNRVDQANFADERQEDLLYEPQLSSYQITYAGSIWVWIPLPERELLPMLENCGLPEVGTEIEDRERRKALRQRTVSCAQSYVELQLDGKLISTPAPLREYRTSVGLEQFGVRLVLSHLQPAPGRHTLKVVTKFPLEEDSKEDYRTTYIPFEVITEQ